MNVAAALLELAARAGCASVAVVGLGKHAGKTVVVAALAAELELHGAGYGLCTIGRDGEALDGFDASAKPRLALGPGAIVATAAALATRSPALEILAAAGERCALGPLVLAAVRAPTLVELAGPASAAAVRRVVALLAARAGTVVIDGAVDRLAALRGGGDAIVVAAGAANAPTLERAASDVAALVERLRLPLADPGREALRLPGALTPAVAAALARAGERRQVVVADATCVALGGAPLGPVLARLDVRCERALTPVACTVAPGGPERSFEPAAFLRAVADRTGLPAFDVYAAACARPPGVAA